MDTDSTTNLLTDFADLRLSPRISTAKNPLKRLGSKIKQELDEIRAFQKMSLEEIRALNYQRYAEHVKRQDEKERVMTEKYGVVGRVVAKRTRTTFSRPPCCALVVTDPNRYN